MKPIVMIAALSTVAIAGGGGAGWFLHTTEPPPEAEMCDAATDPDCTTDETTKEAEAYAEPDPDVSYEYIRMSGQFVVPVLSETRVTALVVLSLTIEAESGIASKVDEKEPKLRDKFLQVLFDHAQSGGFSGPFTTGQPMRDLRAALTLAARTTLGSQVHGVLVTDMVRQDL
ncbi:MAG: flagellar basal body-associated FliL family protein [Pseudomonadota bacterium]